MTGKADCHTTSLLEELALLDAKGRAKALAELSDQEAYDLLHTWRGFMARPDQLAPAGDWRTWLILSGRGWGKSRTLSEYVREEVDSNRARNIALVAPTAADVRDIIVTGPAGLLSVWPEKQRPIYEPSKRRLTFHTGGVATTFSAEDPDSLRGQNSDAAGLDELAAYKYPQEVWDMLSFGLRLGKNPRAVITTTPRPIELIKTLVKDSSTVVTRGSTLENKANLAASFIHDIRRRYEGTRLGRQEIFGEILEDLEGALWNQTLLDSTRVKEPPQLIRIAVGVDPSAGDKVTNDEQGVGIVGLGEDDHIYVLGDRTCKLSPEGWGEVVVRAVMDNGADCVYVEINAGGQMAESVIRSAAKELKTAVRVKPVVAKRGKHVRAEPIAAVFEQGRGHLVGNLPRLEDELCGFTAAGYTGAKSPNRADAMIWAATGLLDSDRRLVTNIKKGTGKVLHVPE